MTTADRLTLALVILTSVYVCLTFWALRVNQSMVRVMTRQLEAATRPFIAISVDIPPDKGFFVLSISNAGNSPALRLRLSLDKDLFMMANPAPTENLRTQPAFSREVACFPPRSTLVFPIGTGPLVFGSENAGLIPQVFTVSASYEAAGATYQETTTVDLAPFHNTSIPQDAVANQLAEIAKGVQSLNASFARGRA